jgi:hypothetical protein
LLSEFTNPTLVRRNIYQCIDKKNSNEDYCGVTPPVWVRLQRAVGLRYLEYLARQVDPES